jgi:hypothetical protein
VDNGAPRSESIISISIRGGLLDSERPSFGWYWIVGLYVQLLFKLAATLLVMKIHAPKIVNGLVAAIVDVCLIRLTRNVLGPQYESSAV